METSCASEPPATDAQAPGRTVYALLYAISLAHLLNDTVQALLPSIYPLLKGTYHLSFTQLGLITFTFQGTASLLQPVVGWMTDRKPRPMSLAASMALSLAGLIWLSMAHSFAMIIGAAALIGLGSAIFHPEASRIAFMAAGGRRGYAQSLFQVGGNTGSSFGPLLAALIVMPRGQGHIAWFAVLAFAALILLWKVGGWQRRNVHRLERQPRTSGPDQTARPSRRTIAVALLVLIALIFSKYLYLASMGSYYTFYLMDRFGMPASTSQIYLSLFLLAVAAGTIIGGPMGDRFGRKRVIWGSILGVAPFSLWLPHAGLALTALLTVCIGLILASAFSAIVVYAQELMPGNVGMIAGLFFGLAFGTAGIGSAVLGVGADRFGINAVFQACAFLPLLGLLAVFLPEAGKNLGSKI